MSLTCSSCKKSAFCNVDTFDLKDISEDEIIISLAGNPNTGKSTVFNALTGLNQHTGNWPGKTVTKAYGKYTYKDKRFVLVDLPGTYSLLANSIEEQVARDFICFGKPAVSIIVVDATCLERNLNLVIQMMEITNNVIVCLNLMDEARRKKIHIDVDMLSNMLGVPVIPTSARNKEGLDELIDAIYNVSAGMINPEPMQVQYDNEIEETILSIQDDLDSLFEKNINSRWLALRLIEGDTSILESIEKHLLKDDIKYKTSQLLDAILTARRVN